MVSWAKEISGRPVNYIFPQLHDAKVGLADEKKNDFGHTLLIALCKQRMR